MNNMLAFSARRRRNDMFTWRRRGGLRFLLLGAKRYNPLPYQVESGLLKCIGPSEITRNAATQESAWFCNGGASGDGSGRTKVWLWVSKPWALNDNG